MKTLESIASDALLLPLEQRLSLAHQMLLSVDSETDPDVDKAWDEEIQKRIREYDNGEVSAIPGPEVFRQVREKLKK